MKYNLVSDGDRSNLTAFVDGEMYVADSSHPNFKAILTAVIADDETVVSLFDPSVAAAENFHKVSERVSVAGGKVYFDGDLVDNAITGQILRFLEEGVDDWKPLVNFFEKVSSNPNSHSRTQLYTWVAGRDITITDDGDILAYKALYPVEGGFKSSASGSATVNGVAHNGQIPQNFGDVVEMPRSAVQHDPSVGCHTGLHVGTWDYARDFLSGRGAVVAVKVNPRDIVSVPTDCEAAKVRTCRYVLSHLVEAPIPGAVWHGEQSDDDDDNYNSCEDCGRQVRSSYEILCDDCADEHCSSCGEPFDLGTINYCPQCGTAV